MTHDEMIEVIAHHKNGGKVEYRCKGDSFWIKENHLDASGFNFADFDYRAKPELLVLWGVYFANGAFATASQSEDAAREAAKNIGIMMQIKKFVEVTE
jgi:hypothetical protein